LNKMAYRPLNDVKESLKTLPSKINDALDYLYTLFSTNTGRVDKSITTSPENGKIQLVNDLSDNELLPNIVYGTDDNAQRGWIKYKAVANIKLSDWLTTSDGKYYYIVEHGLNSEDITVSCYENNVLIQVDEVLIVDENNVKITVNERTDLRVVIGG